MPFKTHLAKYLHAVLFWMVGNDNGELYDKNRYTNILDYYTLFYCWEILWSQPFFLVITVIVSVFLLWPLLVLTEPLLCYQNNIADYLMK